MADLPVGARLAIIALVLTMMVGLWAQAQRISDFRSKPGSRILGVAALFFTLFFAYLVALWVFAFDLWNYQWIFWSGAVLVVISITGFAIRRGWFRSSTLAGVCPVIYPARYRLSDDGRSEGIELVVETGTPQAYNVQIEPLITSLWMASFTRDPPLIGSGFYVMSLQSTGPEQKIRTTGLADVLTRDWEIKGKPDGLVFLLYIRYTDSENHPYPRRVCEVSLNKNRSGSLGIEISHGKLERMGGKT